MIIIKKRQIQRNSNIAKSCFGSGILETMPEMDTPPKIDDTS